MCYQDFKKLIDICSAYRLLPTACLRSTPIPSIQQILRQRPVELHARIQRHVIDAELETIAAVEFAEIADRFQIVGLKTVGVDLQSLSRFRLFELDDAVETEMRPRLRRECETKSRRARACRSRRKALDHRLRLGQQIGEQHHQAAVLATSRRFA